MSTNDEVRVDIHEDENAETSPQEHIYVMDTTIASQNQPSKEEMVEIRTSLPQYQAVRINIAQENEEHEKMDELVRSPPPKLIAHKDLQEILTNEVVNDTRAASTNESSDEIVENDTSVPHEDQLDNPIRIDGLDDAALKKLKEAAVSNDWKKAYNEVFKKDPVKNSEYFTAGITVDDDTALHVAIRAGSARFVRKMLNYMTKEQLTSKNCFGTTAFHLAASLGRLKLVKLMFKKNEKLAGMRGKWDVLPIYVAAMQGNYKMVQFLYRVGGPLQKADSIRLFLYWTYETFLLDDPRIKEDLEKLYIVTLRNDWNTAFQDIFKQDPFENSKYLTAKISENEDTTLHVAIASQSFTFAEELIKYMKRKDLSIKNKDGNTAFFLVATFGNVRLANQMFVKNLELPNIRGKNAMLPIHKADERGHKLMVKFLHRIGRPLEEMDRKILSAIASKNGLSEEIVENGISCPPTNQADYPRMMEIHRILSNAAMDNDWNIAYKDIFKGDPFKNSKYLTAKISEGGNIALHLATVTNSIGFVNELIKYMLKEELTITNDAGDTAFLLAAGNGRVDVAKVMFEKNRWLPNIRGYLEMLPIHVAARNGHREMVEFLYGIQGPLPEIDSNRLFLNLRFTVSLFDDPRIKKSLNKLYTTAWMNDWNTAHRDIFEGDVSKNSKYLAARISNKEDTALHIAAWRKSSTFVEELVKYMRKEDLAIKNSDGNTAFFLVAASGNVRLVEQMFEKNVELPSIHGDKEMLPIHKAAQQGHKMMVEFLYGIQGPLIEKDTNKFFDYWWLDQHIAKKLYRAALKDDLNTATKICHDHPNYITSRISQKGDIALHIAVEAQSSSFVQVLVDKMNPEDLEIKNHDGNTAFCLVAASGNLQLARKMFCKNSELRNIHGEKEMLPIHMGAQSGHKEMVEFLYDISGDYLNDEDHIKLINSLIRSGLYGLAHNYLYKRPDLANRREESNWETALHILARTPKFANQKQQGIFKRWNKGNDKALELVKWLLQQIRLLEEDKISEIIEYTWPVIFTAVEQGNIDFLTIIIREFPDLILKFDRNNYSIFHVAVLNRQKEIFKLIDKISLAFKKPIFQCRDKAGNNILHLAGMMPPQERLNNVSGVALQLQQELFWFEEVSQIVDPMDVEAKNKKGKTPTDIFKQKIKALKDKGEKWMKDTANSCMIVATLITTVVFAAAFTVPGGIKDETGTPNFIQKASFTMFVISDAISLVSSSCSILTFLSILTGRYADEDFRYVLPRQLVVGLLTLFFSIAAMMVVFCTTIFIVYKDGKIWIPILVTGFASFPVILFTLQQWNLLYDVARATFKLSFLFKTNKNSLFGDDDDEGKSWSLIKKWKDSTCWNFPEECWNSPSSTLLSGGRDMCSKEM
ncbi:hypothetical protein Pint_12288 [Pistacia integerrima]|uniref:Uncharacterized protein n=1 Tax=Pistacia integerrima TaxID=434235 RepID=A0ACC0XKN8_9ROSI|nr:hypothetical protein Pint_12288 [Pistacia integerrima]